MPKVKSVEAITQRIAEVERKLIVIRGAREEERKRPFFERKFFPFLFLDKEKRIYSAILRELRWVLSDE